MNSQRKVYDQLSLKSSRQKWAQVKLSLEDGWEGFLLKEERIIVESSLSEASSQICAGRVEDLYP